jgi:hypothetical protein
MPGASPVFIKMDYVTHFIGNASYFNSGSTVTVMEAYTNSQCEISIRLYLYILYSIYSISTIYSIPQMLIFASFALY